MATKAVKVKDRGWVRISLALKAMDGYEATIGVHGDAGAHKGDIDNVGLAAIHEFGVQFRHPGGTPFMVASQGGSSRSGGMVGAGQVTFLRKGDPRAIGITRPHMIQIPERSFLRSAWDKNVRKYERALQKQAGQVIDGKATAKQAIGRVAEKALGDIVRGINRGIPPPNAPATIRRKGSSKPLIDTGQLKMAIKVKVGKR